MVFQNEEGLGFFQDLNLRFDSLQKNNSTTVSLLGLQKLGSPRLVWARLGESGRAPARLDSLGLAWTRRGCLGSHLKIKNDKNRIAGNIFPGSESQIRSAPEKQASLK